MLGQFLAALRSVSRAVHVTGSKCIHEVDCCSQKECKDLIVKVYQVQRNVLKGRRESSCKTKTDGDRQGGVERVLRSAGREERDGATLVLDIFDLVPAT